MLKSARTGTAVPFGYTVPSSATWSDCSRDVVWIGALWPMRPERAVVATHVRLGRDVLRALPHRLRPLAYVEVRLERRRDALVEVEVEVPRLDVLVDVREVHVRAVTEVVAAAEVDVAERLEVRDRARPHAGLLRRGEAEEQLGRVRDQVGARNLRGLCELLRQ